MHSVKRTLILVIVAGLVGAASFTRATLSAAVVKVPDPTKVVMIVDRDSNDISVIDMLSLTKIKTIPGLVEPLNTVFTPDGSKAYVGNYGAHWVGVIDVRRHELLKKIQVGDVPGVAKLDPDKYLGEIQGINIPPTTNEGKFH